MHLIPQAIIVPAAGLVAYKQLDAETIATVSGDRVAIWNIEGDDAIQLACVAPGTSGLSTDQLIAKLWN
jgi:hypothetical protein